MIWAGIFRLCGSFSDASLIALYGLDTLLAGTAACCWLWLIREILPHRSKGPLPMLAVLIASLAPEHLVTLTRPWYWGLQKLGVATMLICALKWHRSPDLKRSLAFGAATGSTLLVNSVPLLLFVGLVLRSFLRSLDRRRTALTALISTAVCIAMLLPWIVRNYSAHGAFVPLRLNSWVEIRQGNNPNGSIVQSLNSLHPNLKPYERDIYFEGGELAYAERAKNESMLYLFSHPGDALARTGLRAALFWFADLFHEGIYGDTSWSEKGLYQRVRDIAILITAIAPILLLLVSWAAGWLQSVREMCILTTPLLALPIPYYISHIHPVYFASVKPILLMLVVIGVGEALRKYSSS